MLIVFDINTNKIIGVYSGNLNSIKSLFPRINNVEEKYNAIHLEDNKEIKNNWNDYKIVNGNLIKKDRLLLALDKKIIQSDGIDTSILTIIIDSNEQFNTVDVFFNKNKITVALINNKATIEIVSEQSEIIIINGDFNEFISDEVCLEVV